MRPLNARSTKSFVCPSRKDDGLAFFPRNWHPPRCYASLLRRTAFGSSISRACPPRAPSWEFGVGQRTLVCPASISSSPPTVMTSRCLTPKTDLLSLAGARSGETGPHLPLGFPDVLAAPRPSRPVACQVSGLGRSSFGPPGQAPAGPPFLPARLFWLGVSFSLGSAGPAFSFFSSGRL